MTPSLLSACRFAVRELRGGFADFRLFIAAIALGVAAIASVGMVTRAITEGLNAEGSVILGGDLSFSLMHRQPGEAEYAFLRQAGALSTIATLRAMARTPTSNAQALVEVKAVDAAYPLTGRVTLREPLTLHAALARQADGSYGLAVDPLLAARLDATLGSTLLIGYARFTITAHIVTEPDKVASGIDFGPRVMMRDDALAATGLIQPGSLVRYSVRVKLPEGARPAAAADLAAEAKQRFPETGWRITTRDNASPGLERNINRFAQFLTLVGLTALITGGVGITNAVRAYVEKKRETIATFKALGAPGGYVALLYLMQIMAIAGIGILIGLTGALLLLWLGGEALGNMLGLPIRFGFYAKETALAALYGFFTALSFSLWALGRVHDIPVSALFRDRVSTSARLPRPLYLVGTIVALATLAGLAVFFAHDRMIGSVFVGAAAAAFALLGLIALAIMALARRTPAPRSVPLRLALRNIHRPGGLTVSVVLSLGLGLALLVTLALIDVNLRSQLTGRLPEKAPDFFFLDIQSSEAERFVQTLDKAAPGVVIDQVPMLRGRLVALKGVDVDQIKLAGNTSWVLDGERGLTYAAELPRGSTLVSGKWWPSDHSGEALVSFDAELAEELGLVIGDSVTVNVLGRDLTAKIANTRRVEWESLAINFVMVFSPNAFSGAPHSVLATASLPEGTDLAQEIALMKHMTGAFPTISAVRVREVLEAVNKLLSDLALAVRLAASIALLSSLMVLAGALAASHRQRVYDAVLLKTLGATRARVLAAFIAEYALLGFAAALFGVIAGGLAASGILEGLMDIDARIDPSVAFLSAALALFLTIGFGLLGTWRVLDRKAAPVLRNL